MFDLRCRCFGLVGPWVEGPAPAAPAAPAAPGRFSIAGLSPARPAGATRDRVSTGASSTLGTWRRVCQVSAERAAGSARRHTAHPVGRWQRAQA
jgi:hypothetical protein